jgi:hypothetical protein
MRQENAIWLLILPWNMAAVARLGMGRTATGGFDPELLKQLMSNPQLLEAELLKAQLC